MTTPLRLKLAAPHPLGVPGDATITTEGPMSHRPSPAGTLASQ